MDKENDAVNPAAADERGYPSHYCFAENLIVNEILGDMPEVHMPAVAWSIRKRNLIIFLREYINRHNCLPHGRHQIDDATGFGCFNEAIDFVAVKQKIHNDMKKKYYLYREVQELPRNVTRIKTFDYF